MKIKLKTLPLFFVILAIFIPDFWFFAGRQILNGIYLIAFIFFAIYRCEAKHRIHNYHCYPVIFLASLIIYAIQAVFDSGLITGFNYFMSTVMVTIIVANCVDGEESINKLLDTIICVSVPFLILGIAETLFKYNVFHNLGFTLPGASFYSEERLGIFRISGIFGHPIVYCNFLTIIAGIIIYRMPMNNPKKEMKYWCIYLLCILNAFLTVSRSALLILLAEQFVLLYLKRIRWVTKGKLFALLCVVFGLFISELLGGGLLNKVSDMINMLLQVVGLGSSEYNSTFSSFGYTDVVGDRNLLYEWVPLSLGENTLFGNGTYATFSYAVDAYRTKSSIENYYLHTLFRHGYFGLLIMVIGLVALLVWCYKIFAKRNVRTDAVKRFTGKLDFSALMLVLIIGEIIMYFSVDQSGEARLLYVCIGLLVAYKKTKRCVSD